MNKNVLLVILLIVMAITTVYAMVNRPPDKPGTQQAPAFQLFG